MYHYGRIQSSFVSQTADLSFTSPRKTYKSVKFACGDEYDANIVRRIVHNLYEKHKNSTTLAEYKKKTEYKGSGTSLWRILKSQFQKTKNLMTGVGFLIKRNDIVAT